MGTKAIDAGLINNGVDMFAHSLKRKPGWYSITNCKYTSNTANSINVNFIQNNIC